ncbi:HBL/NHE enterotoxin family protein [Bacillus sp. 196mf]|uniref:HBL/NHE enterotoxin family protein n=1 Tax=Bacillus sp. 196mf TaxID=1761754 RepID=UPI000D7BC4E4|nr:HBL/NHE enterotoxin family protein [Bacillus sp. 196mf]PYE87499.1 hemolytic enterotoxin HBL [Bacillus sp. 196mf]
MNNIAYADEKTSKQNFEGLKFSASLSEMAVNFKETQKTINNFLKTPNIELTNLPSLQEYQDSIKTDMKYWIDEIDPSLIVINEENKRFLRTYDTYSDSIHEILDNLNNNTRGTDAKLTKRLEVLQNKVVKRQSDLDSIIQKTKRFQTKFEKHTGSLSSDFTAATLMINKLTGKGAELSKEIEQIKKDMDDDLKIILAFPGAINEQAIAIGMQVYDLIQEPMKAVSDSAIKTYKTKEKGQDKGHFDKVIDIVGDGWEKVNMDKALKIQESYDKLASASTKQKQSLSNIISNNKKLYEKVIELDRVDIQIADISLKNVQLKKIGEQIEERISSIEDLKMDYKKLESFLILLQDNTKAKDRNKLSKFLGDLEDFCLKVKKESTTFESILNENN